MRLPRLEASAVRSRFARAVVCGLLLATTLAFGQTTLLDDVHTVATSAVAVPVEHDFTIAAAGTYQVQLTDLGAALTPAAPLAAVKLAITGGDALVGTPLEGPGILQFTAPTAGTYRLHVVGKAGTTPGSGPIGIAVTRASDGSLGVASSDTLAAPPQALPNSVALINDSFTVATSGNYQVTLTDLGFPQSLGYVTLLLTAQGAAQPLTILPTQNHGLQATVALTSNITYQIFAIGAAGTGATAGLYSAVITPSGGGTAAYTRTVAIGGTVALGSADLAAGPYTLSAADLSFPAALAQIGTLVVFNGQAAAPPLTAAGSKAFTASAGNYQVFAVATPANSPGAGSYSVELQPQGGVPVLGVARAVATPGSTLSAYSFDVNIATAGAYGASLYDYQTPTAVQAARFAVVQGGALSGPPLTSPGTLSLSAAAGPLTLLAFVQGGTGGSLVDLNVAAAGAAPVFDQPVGVGATFESRPVSVTVAGRYTVTVADLGFPADFTTLAAVVTQGTTVLGSTFGAGPIAPFQAAAGTYFVNFLATPGGSDDAGTYALNFSTAPAAPVVNFNSSASNVTAGATVTLTWTTQGATSCDASGSSWSGHWTGAQAASNTVTSPPISTTVTFTLSCSGTGGSASQSVTVSAQAAPAKGGGGGGSIGVELLLMLAAVLVWRSRSAR
jgi:hypothetical protein